LRPGQLRESHISEINDALAQSGYTHTTKSRRADAIGNLLRWLWTEKGAAKLDDKVHKFTGVRPRNVTAERDEIEAMLELAQPHMQLFILLCSDLALRSGTAALVCPADYSAQHREIRITTKGGAKLSLPVTEEIRQLIERCDSRDPRPFIRQLWQWEPGRHGRSPA
jgi:integrase